MKKCEPAGTTSRREFIKGSLALSSFLAIARRVPGESGESTPPADSPVSGALRPNVLWISSEDHGPQMGCYGDTYAVTPSVDRLAAKGMIYLHAWSTAPVCAPTRTTLISGMYGPSSGGDHMRSMVPYPEGKKMFPQFLREAGYYCSNNNKQDYNLALPGEVWDNSSGKAHWKNRKPGQPFFAVFNSNKSHEQRHPEKMVHDPAKARVPAYNPDTPEVRKDWAQYYDSVTDADADAGKLLDALAEDGLAEETIVWYWADHGPGMPRCKRWPCDSGLHVPLVVYIPEKFKRLRPPEYKAGGKSERLVNFVDFAPTMLSLAGIKPPDWMQGHAFMGEFIEPPQPFMYGFRGRMDERYDLVRTVTDGRHVYLRNYMPHVSQGQHVKTQFGTSTTKVWRKLFDEGKLNEAQSIFWRTPKAPEELYDLQTDPDEVKNLAVSPEHQEILAKLRKAQQDLALKIRDVGFAPEGERMARCKGASPYDWGHDESKYPFERVFAAAELASWLKPEAAPELRKLMADEDSAVRYWGAMGLLMRGAPAVVEAKGELTAALKDSSNYVRIAAAQALAQYGDEAGQKTALPALVELSDGRKHDLLTVMAGLNALSGLGAKAAPAAKEIMALPSEAPAPDKRYSSNYLSNLLKDVRASLGGGTESKKPGAQRKG